MSESDTGNPGTTVDDARNDNLGVAGNVARTFIQSPLSPLFYLAMLLMGILGLLLTPRQEDPQISVPMVDILVSYPGAEAAQVASLAIQPLERIMFEIEGVEHVYSASMRGRGIVTVQFEVGEKMEPSLVKVNDQLASNMNKIPPGVEPPLVQAKGIDDVPVVTLTLWSEKDYNGDGNPDVDDSQLRRLAHSVLQKIKEIPDTGEGFVVGGRAEQVIVEVYPERLAGFGIGLGQVADKIRSANTEQQAGNVEAASAVLPVITGAFLRTGADIEQLQIGSHNGVPVFVRDVADVRQGPEDAKQLVLYYSGVGAQAPAQAAVGIPAVTIAVAKKKGTNGVEVASDILDRVESLRGHLIPNDIQVSVTRNYGETARDKVNDLIKKLFIATFFVFLLVWLAFRALKPALVVLLVIPVVLLFTVFCAWVMGFTIDRVSLFALIFSIGILVDDAIVVVENIYRRWLEKGATTVATAVDAVREVGNPTILATFTVIGALLPMGFVSGMMGPYMLPIPVLGSVAMFISLFAAFVFTPWLAIHGVFRPSMRYLETAGTREHREAERLDGFFRRVLEPLIAHPGRARLFRLAMWGALLASCALFYFQWVAVKMLPLDNKPEFSVVLDMPEGTALIDTANTADRIAQRMRAMPEVTAVQVYAGTARPFDFNGLVRHYYLRKEPWQAEIQVQLLHKDNRPRSSHEIAVDARAQLRELFAGSDVRFAVVEMPPGPPVLQSVVAEVHHEDPDIRREVARDLTAVFEEARNLRDVDNYMQQSYDYWHFQVDREKADRRGIETATINEHLAMALGGYVLGDVKQRAGHEPVNIVVQVPLAERAQVTRLGDILVQGSGDGGVPLRELGHFERVPAEDVIYHKDLRGVEYVVADVGGRLAAPVYGMLQVEQILDERDYVAPDGTVLAERGFWMGPPPSDQRAGFEWAGEWTVTYETFRDMGLAFGAALVLIYVLVVWEFGNFRIPALIMAPIPLTLIGIIPAHMLFFQMGWGGEFTATSMIGWIALAGIIVRNSILLVDFSIHEVRRGVPVAEAVISACKTRTRPILITALALVAGSSVIFFDPIFQGMAISLASGVLVSTILTLIVIPLGCVKHAEALQAVAGGQAPDDGAGGADATASAPDPGPAPTPVLLRLWSGLISAILFVIAVVRGVFLLLAQVATRLRRPSPQAATAAATEPVTSSTSPIVVDPTAVDPPQPPPEKSPPPTRPTAGSERTAASRADPVNERASETAAAPPASAEATPAKRKKKVARKKSGATRSGAVKRAAPAAPPTQQTGTDTAAAPKRSTKKKGGVGKRPKAKSDGAGAAKATTAAKTAAKRVSEKKSTTVKAPESTADNKNGGRRRGIRLKSLDDGDGLS